MKDHTPAKHLEIITFLQYYSGKAVNYLDFCTRQPRMIIKEVNKELLNAKGDHKRHLKARLKSLNDSIRKEEKTKKMLIDSCLFFEDSFVNCAHTTDSDAGEMHDRIIDKTGDFCDMIIRTNDNVDFESALLFPLEKIEPNCVIINRKPYRVLSKYDL